MTTSIAKRRTQYKKANAKRKRNYSRENEVTNSRPLAKKKRARANAARAKLGLKKGDKRDAGHINASGGNSSSNIKPQSRSANRSAGGKKGSKAGKATGGRKSRARKK